MVMLDKLRKLLRRPTFFTFVEPIVYLQNISSLGLFHRHNFGKYSSKFVAFILLSRGNFCCYCDNFYDFEIIIRTCHLNSSFPYEFRIFSSDVPSKRLQV